MAEWQTRTLEGRVGISCAGSSPVIRTKNLASSCLHFFADNWQCALHTSFLKTFLNRYSQILLECKSLRIAKYIWLSPNIDKSSYPHQTKQIRTISGADFLFGILHC